MKSRHCSINACTASVLENSDGARKHYNEKETWRKEVRWGKKGDGAAIHGCQQASQLDNRTGSKKAERRAQKGIFLQVLGDTVANMHWYPKMESQWSGVEADSICLGRTCKTHVFQ